MTGVDLADDDLILMIPGLNERECAHLNTWYDESTDLADRLGRSADISTDCVPLLGPILNAGEPNMTEGELLILAEKLIDILRHAVYLRDAPPAGYA